MLDQSVVCIFLHFLAKLPYTVLTNDNSSVVIIGWQRLIAVLGNRQVIIWQYPVFCLANMQTPPSYCF